MPPYFVGIAGPSSVGKSTICRQLAAESDKIEHIQLDDYFKDRETFPQHKKWENWDLPQNLLVDELQSNLQQLQEGKPIQERIFNIKGGHEFGYRTLQPVPLMLVEGWMLFYFERIRQLFDYKLFITCSSATQRRRRRQRERDFEPEQFNEIILPAYRKYVQPTKQYADALIDGEQNMHEVRRALVQTLQKHRQITHLFNMSVDP